MKTPEEIQADVTRLVRQKDEAKKGQAEQVDKLGRYQPETVNYKEAQLQFDFLKHKIRDYDTRIHALEWVLA